MTRSARSVAMAAIMVLLGCSSDPATDVVVEPQQDAEPTDSGSDVVNSDALDATLDVEAEASDATDDAAAAAVRVGLYPTPAETLDGGMDEAASSEAVLMALAAGADGLVVDLDWEQVPPQTDGAPDSLAHLGAIASHLNDERKKLVFSLSVVNASADRRPAALSGQPWSGGSTREAMREAIDRVFGTFGEEVAYVSLGMEVDRYLASHPTQGTAFVGFMKEALEYARAHPSRPEGTGIGLTWSAAAWSGEATDTSNRDALADASDAVMLAYYGLDGSDHLLAPSEAVAALASVIESIEGRPVVLHRVAYTTTALLGSSESAQAAFVSELLGMVGQHREQVPFVGVALLHDPAPEACLRFAQARALSNSAELYAYWCSAGLRDRQGAPKEGFLAFLDRASMPE